MICRRQVIWVGVAILLAISSANTAPPNRQRLTAGQGILDISLHSVSPPYQVPEDSIFSVDLDFAYADTFDVSLIAGFRFTVAYDQSAMLLWDVVDNGLRSQCGWFLGYFVGSVVDSAGFTKSILSIVGEDTSETSCDGLGCHEVGEALTTIQFQLFDSPPGRVSTTIDFYWDTCQANTFWTKGRDTIFAASQVFDSDGNDITDLTQSFPSSTGPESRCYEPYGDTVVVSAVRFYNTEVALGPPSDVGESSGDDGSLPSTAHLGQNYPNPFNPGTTIEFYLSDRSSWRLEVINLSGRVVAEWAGRNGPGNGIVRWDGCDRQGRQVASGVYFYRLVTKEYHLAKKMLLLK